MNTVQSSAEFMEHIKTKADPCGYRLIFFDVISLFTDVLLDATIVIVLKCIYDNRGKNTTINKREIKQLMNVVQKMLNLILMGLHMRRKTEYQCVHR